MVQLWFGRFDGATYKPFDVDGTGAVAAVGGLGAWHGAREPGARPTARPISRWPSPRRAARV